jgi:hypothetical protein
MLAGAGFGLALVLFAFVPALRANDGPAVVRNAPVAISTIQLNVAPEAAIKQVKELHAQVAETMPGTLPAVAKPHQLRIQRLMESVPKYLEAAEKLMDRDPEAANRQIRRALKSLDTVQKHMGHLATAQAKEVR